MTRSRSAVLLVLQSAPAPLTAAEVRKITGASMDPATVYRTLHYLEEHGYAASFVLHCEAHGTERYWTALVSESGEALPHHHWFHCEQCHCFLDMGNCRLEPLLTGLEREYEVVVTGHTLHLSGLCPGCKAARSC